MIDKHAILAGLVGKQVRVKYADFGTEFGTMADDEQGGVVGNLVELGDRYGVEDTDEDPNVVIIREKFPIEKVLGVLNLRFQPVVVLKI